MGAKYASKSSTWKGDKQHGNTQTSRLLDRIGPMGRFDENTGLSKKKIELFQRLTFENMHLGPIRRLPKLIISGTSSLFQCLKNSILINLLFLMTKNGPLQAELSKYWVSTRLKKESLKTRQGRPC